MRRAVTPASIFLLYIFLSSAAVGQGEAQNEPLRFVAADVHVSAPGATESSEFLPNGRVEFYGTTLLHLITAAWSIGRDRVIGGPSWLDTDRFDVVAQASGPASEQELRKMLQGLMAKRFHLEVQNREQLLPVYALVADAHRGKESSGSAESGCRRGRQEGFFTYTCRNTTVAALAEAIRRVAYGYFDAPVVDRSGLSGEYDFKLRWIGANQMEPGDQASLYRSLEKQLGLKVEKATASFPVLAIAHVDRRPTGNAPDAIEKLGTPPTEFEVADVRPSRPDEETDSSNSNGRYELTANSLRDMIVFAYNLEADRVIGEERWLDGERFDVVAKTVPTASTDAIRVMMQSLLAERFGLRVHKEQRPVTVYALSVAKARLTEADPAELDTCRAGFADGERVFACQNTTMAEFAEKIRDEADGYLEHPIVDFTGLEGGYDFTLNWSPRAENANRRRRGPVTGSAASGNPAPLGAVPQVADRPRGMTIVEGIGRLGLKLRTEKYPLDVIVIDHIQRQPTDN